MEKIKKQLIRHEGLKLKPYYCPAGKLTIGVGRNLEDRGISKTEAMVMLEADIKTARSDVEFILDHYNVQAWKVNAAREGALVNVAFNIGRRSLLGFRKMFVAIRFDDWDKAADELLDSKYAEDVGGRAVELADQLRSGKYQIKE